MQITDANYASEGFSQTWFPHLWRIKCEPLIDSQEFSQILQAPINTDNYLGQWDKTKPYPPGYIISYGDKNYESIKDVPAGTNPPDPEYWKLTDEQNLRDILATYNKNIEINNAVLEEANRILPYSGYDADNLYVVPTYGLYVEDLELSGKLNQPAPPINVMAPDGPPVTATGTVVFMRSPEFKNPSPVIRIPKSVVKSFWDLTADYDPISAFKQLNLEIEQIIPERTDTGSGSVETTKVLSVLSAGTITGPYGTADNTYSTADQNPELPGFTDSITPQMDFRADCDPRFQYIARSSPRSFGYTYGYMTGNGIPPNGFPLGSGTNPTGVGISFPANPQVGDYFLRIDYLPQLLYRWNGGMWVRISSNVRTGTGMVAPGEIGHVDQSQLSGFINNDNLTKLTDGTFVPQKQALSKILTVAPDPLPPKP